MHRRLLLASLAAATLAPALGRAATSSRVPLADAFLLLDSYLALPPAERSRFHMAYRIVRDPHAATAVAATIVGVDGSRTPVAIDSDGFIVNLPTLAQLKSKAKFETSGGRLKIGLEMRATMAPATRIEAAELALTLAQVNAALVTFADGAEVGRLTDSYFPGAEGGEAVSGAGVSRALPVFTLPDLGALPYFDAAKDRDATAVLLNQPPSRIFFAGPPRKP